MLVSSQIGKASRRFLRTKLLPHLVQEDGETQVGGLPGCRAARASLLVRLTQSLAKARILSFGALFMDVARAFYRDIRELAIHSQLDDDSVAAIARAAGLLPSAMQVLAQRLRDHGASLAHSDVDPHVVQQVARRYQAPWFACEGSIRYLPRRGHFPQDNSLRTSSAKFKLPSA